MNMSAPESFHYAKEVATQLITLSTGVIAVTATFIKDMPPTVSPSARRALYCSWIAFLLTIVFGVLVLAAMTGTLATVQSVQAIAIYDWNIRLPSTLQFFSFIIGIALLLFHAVRSAK
jgi:hypothetical protein